MTPGRIGLNNGRLEAEISPVGAELLSLRPTGGSSVIWGGSPDTWARSAPVVFPVLGGWPDGRYTWKGKTYSMQKNGFARTALFRTVQAENDRARLELKDTPETREAYPFRFTLAVTFLLAGSKMRISCALRNDGEEEMPWIIGFHPGFRWNRSGGGAILFSGEQTGEAFHPDGGRECLADHARSVALTEDLFRRGALSTDQITCPWIDLDTGFEDLPKVRLHREQFPFITLWSMDRTDAAFVCVEPTTGAGASGPDLRDRTGIRFLPPGEGTELFFTIELPDQGKDVL